MKTAEIYIAELDHEVTQRDFLALGLLVLVPDTDYALIFQSDAERLSKLTAIMARGGFPVAAMCVVNTPDGFVAGSSIFVHTSSVRHVVDRETEICRKLLQEQKIVCQVH